MSRLAEEVQDAIDAWFASGMKVRQQPIGQFVAERITALQSDSELLREAKWKLGDKLTKKSGSKWRGTVVGFYSTELTPIGYAIESDTETGSVQIYPEKALARLEQGDEV